MAKSKSNKRRLSSSELEALRQKRNKQKQMDELVKYESRDYFTLRRLVIAAIIFVASMTLNIINSFISEQTIITSILYGISNTLTLLSYLTFIDTPMLTVIMMFMSQWCLIGNDIYLGYTLNEALNNAGPMEVYCWAALPIIASLNIKKLKKTSWKDKDKDDKIYDVVMYEREAYKVPAWAHFVIWCMTFSMIFMSARGDGVQQINEAKLPIKIYISLAGVIPAVATFMRYTTTNVAYLFMVAITLLRAATLTIMGINRELKITSVLYFILQTIVITIAIVSYIKLCKKSRIAKKEKKKAEKESNEDNKEEDKT